MTKSLACCFFIFLFLRAPLHAEELSGALYLAGLKSSFHLLGTGAKAQFQEKNNLYISTIAIPSLWFAFDQDKRISNLERNKSIPSSFQLASDLSPVLGFPLISIGAYTFGKKYDDPKLVQFAKEYFASMYLAFIESALLSVVDVHQRPTSKKLSKWETQFRGNSSFPSGHVIPYATLAFKTFQFYGPYYALVPTTLLYMTSVQRIRDGKHYLSDVLGGIFLSAFANEGVRRAGGFSNNDPLYRSIFENNLEVGVTQFQGVVGPAVVYHW